ncbi:MAG TPA: hypothetical protein VHA09_01280 [Nitrososphaera sp.]|nr:hypothetical protein [Nitrososphaera sp.]
MTASKNESITFRFDSKLLMELSSEAKRKMVSLNTLMQQISSAHIEWHSRAAEAGFITVRRTLVKNMIDKLSEKEIDHLVESVYQDIEDASLLIVRGTSVEQIFEFLERWIRATGFRFRHDVEGTSHTIIIQHEMGLNWSLYLSKLFQKVAMMIQEKSAVKTSENTVVIKVELKP